MMDIFLSLTGDGIYWNQGQDDEQVDGIFDLDEFFNKSLVDLEPGVAKVYAQKFNGFTDKLYSIARNNEDEKECWLCTHCDVPSYNNDGMADCMLLRKIVSQIDTCDKWIEKEEED